MRQSGAVAIDFGRVQRTTLKKEEAAQMDEHALLRAVLQRDNAAWAELLRRYDSTFKKRIRFLLSHYARGFRGPGLVDDIMSDVFVRLLVNDMRRLRQFDPKRGKPLGTWLSMVATQATFDHLRMLGRGGPVEPIEKLMEDEDHDAQRGARWAAEGV